MELAHWAKCLDALLMWASHDAVHPRRGQLSAGLSYWLLSLVPFAEYVVRHPLYAT